jgi:hypothetical protein
MCEKSARLGGVMTETREVWFNIYSNADGSLATGCMMHPSRAEAEREGALSSYRVGLNRMVLRAEYDKEPVPQEPGALVGRRVRRNSGEIALVLFDIRGTVATEQRWPLVCWDVAVGQTIHLALLEIKELLEDQCG